TVTIALTTTAGGHITDRGCISTNPPGAWPPQRAATPAVRNVKANLDFHLVGSPSAVNAGQQVTYTATIGNHGSGPAATVAFQDLIPGKATLVLATPSQGTCSGNPTIVCALGSLAPGATATVTIVVSTTQPGPIIDRGWISTSPPGNWRHEHDIVTDVKAAPPATTAAPTTTTTTKQDRCSRPQPLALLSPACSPTRAGSSSPRPKGGSDGGRRTRASDSRARLRRDTTARAARARPRPPAAPGETTPTRASR